MDTAFMRCSCNDWETRSLVDRWLGPTRLPLGAVVPRDRGSNGACEPPGKAHLTVVVGEMAGDDQVRAILGSTNRRP